MKRILKHLGVFLLWNLVVSGFLILAPPAIGMPLAVGMSAVLVWGYFLRGPNRIARARRMAALRLRPLRGPTLRWTLVAIPIVLLLSWSLGDIYTQIVPVPPETLNPLEPILRRPGGRLTITIFAVAIAPIIEEFFFRGVIQRDLERRHGTIRGILGAGALFALVHLLPWIFPLHFFLGVTFGFAVWAARSIWAGVLLHAANNAAAMIGLVLTGEEPASTGTLWEIGVTVDLGISVAVLIVSAILAVRTGERLRDAGHGVGLRTP